MGVTDQGRRRTVRGRPVDLDRPITAGADLGHVHFEVAGLERAPGFYRGVLGFGTRQRWGDRAAFIGAADHGGSEALYLHDPDADGIERHRDRPPGQWPLDAEGRLAMGTEPLDLDDPLSEPMPE